MKRPKKQASVKTSTNVRNILMSVMNMLLASTTTAVIPASAISSTRGTESLAKDHSADRPL